MRIRICPDDLDGPAAWLGADRPAGRGDGPTPPRGRSWRTALDLPAAPILATELEAAAKPLVGHRLKRWPGPCISTAHHSRR